MFQFTLKRHELKLFIFFLFFFLLYLYARLNCMRFGPGHVSKQYAYMARLLSLLVELEDIRTGWKLLFLAFLVLCFVPATYIKQTHR